MTAQSTLPIQGGQVAGRPTAAMLKRKPIKKKKPEDEKTEPAEGAKHWSQTKPTAAMMFGRKK